MRAGLVIAVLVAACFPPAYWDAPAAGERLIVKRLPDPRRAYERSFYGSPRYLWISTPGRSTYEVEGRGVHVQTGKCDGEGEAVYTGDETLRFEDGTECPVTMVYPRRDL